MKEIKTQVRKSYFSLKQDFSEYSIYFVKIVKRLIFFILAC